MAKYDVSIAAQTPKANKETGKIGRDYPVVTVTTPKGEVAFHGFRSIPSVGALLALMQADDAARELVARKLAKILGSVIPENFGMAVTARKTISLD